MNARSHAWLAALAAGSLLAAPAAAAQNYPTKPVRIIAASPGTSGDLMTRYLGQRLNERWGQPVVIDNRPGAGAVLAAEVAARAQPDGYTLHMGQLASFAAAPSLHRKLSYDPVRDFAPITLFAHVQLLIIANPAVPAATLREFIEYARTRPGAINYSSGGNGTGGHLTIELISQHTGIRLVHVPYKGVGVATTAIINGEAQLAVIPVPVALPHVKTGKARAYAITSPERFAGAPDVPTTAEAGLPGIESTTWFGMFAPARTPPAILAQLNREIVEIASAPATRDWMLRLGASPAPGTPQQFAAFLKAETAKWKKVIEVSGAKVD
jgi:tripartite-type tricarboxylate transporter receptor subunit TctC